MKLRGKLLLVTGLVAIVPLAGLRFVGQVERLLRDGHEQALVDTATAMASVLSAPDPAHAPVDTEPPLYVHRARQPLLLDGYGDDWIGWLDKVYAFGARRHEAPAAFRPDARRPVVLALADSPAGLNVLLKVRDTDTRFGNGEDSPGERVELRLVGAGREQRLVLAPGAPGPFTRRLPADGQAVRGDWQVHATGWNLELRIPAQVRPDRLGLRVDDIDRAGAARKRLVLADRARLIRTDSARSARLAAIAGRGSRVWLLEPSGHVIAQAARERAAEHGLGDSGARPDDRAGPPGFWRMLLFERLAGEALYEAAPVPAYPARLAGPDIRAARSGMVRPVWRLDRSAAGAGLSVRVSVPLSRAGETTGLLVVERDADALMLLASDAALRLAGASIGLFAAAAGVLLAFAWRLSTRIRRVQHAAEQAVAADGRVRDDMVPAGGSDEIAALSASMAGTLARLRAHQQYLRTLADRLAHELRTPLTLIRSSLDNLEQQLPSADGDGSARVYLERAGEGARRLSRIFQAMNQAARTEEALIDEPFERVDLAELVERYRDARSEAGMNARLEVDRPRRRVVIEGSPDLLAQLLDKLVDNAIDFTPEGGRIVLRVAESGSRVGLEVDNEGPRIDRQRAPEMFEPMVSGRRSGPGGPHLGLGLYIARMIARRHGGSITAVPIDSGTRVRVAFPAPRRDGA